MSLKSRPQGKELDYIKASKVRHTKMRCAICGDIIEGKAWRISESPPRFADTKCANQGTK